MVPKEKVFYRGDGEILVTKVKKTGAGAKIASWLFLGPVGYVIWGRDKKVKSKAQGRLVITNKAIYCAGNCYNYDKILSITKRGTIRKKITLIFEKSVEGQRYDVEVELKSKDINKVFEALEDARMEHINLE